LYNKAVALVDSLPFAAPDGMPKIATYSGGRELLIGRVYDALRAAKAAYEKKGAERGV
jgi:hypothetical protein